MIAFDKVKGAIAACGVVALLGISACHKEAEFKVEGDVADGSGKTLILAKADFGGRWIVIDSTHIDKSGKFLITSAAPGAPDIYRLQLGDNFIYLPVDSIETLRIETSASDFGHIFTLSGTPQAELLSQFEQELMQVNTTDSASMAQFKRDVYTKYIQNGQGSILSYYVLTKFKDNKPLFDASDRNDLKYYTAVATQFEQYKPGDPHGKMVKEASLAGLRAYNKAMGRQQEIAAQEITMLEIALPDEKGTERKLSEVVGKGQPAIVVFSMMTEEQSPALHRGLAQFRDAHPGVQIYEVSFDEDQYGWRDAAANLPWITVLDANGMTSTVARDYNVNVVPTFYLYDGSGNLRDRAFDFKELADKYNGLY